MVFRCSECQRHLPDFMNVNTEQCNDCAGVDIDLDKNSGNENKQPTQRTSGTKSHQKHSDTYNFERGEKSGLRNGNKREETDSANKQASRWPSTEPSAQIYLQTDVPEQFSNFDSCDVFAMGKYDGDSWKNNEYSTKIINYCKNDDQNLNDFFINQLSGFFESRFEGEIEPDLITIYPGHNGDIADGLIVLAEYLESEYGFKYQQLLKRTESRPSQKNQDEDRWENQDGSIDLNTDLNGEVVILLDDIVTSGASVTIAKNALTDAGADTVIAICLGWTMNSYGQMVKILTADSHSVGSVISNE